MKMKASKQKASKQKAGRQKLWSVLGGVLVGVLNGLLGAGGGMLAVPLLKKLGLQQTNAHATSVAVILPLAAMSAAAYLWLDYFQLPDAAVYLLPGIAGALLGALLLAKIPGQWLRKIFACFMIWAGIRMIMR
ncbi:MAG: sulfite exporter TauE/SafE family protein [Oscillospiraceae bacterium]|nr:sulfite exporter TauE/SafE family protein [Oscillospiraceae bacterium]